jgi:hypothetical protein
MITEVVEIVVEVKKYQFLSEKQKLFIKPFTLMM